MISKAETDKLAELQGKAEAVVPYEQKGKALAPEAEQQSSASQAKPAEKKETASAGPAYAVVQAPPEENYLGEPIIQEEETEQSSTASSKDQEEAEKLPEVFVGELPGDTSFVSYKGITYKLDQFGCFEVTGIRFRADLKKTEVEI